MKKRNPEACCETCPYWDSEDLLNGNGVCSRRAPLPGKKFGESALWPFTTENDWCGEHPDFFLEE